jgi:hypothetical protein
VDLGIADDGQRARGEQAAQIAVSLFADTAEVVTLTPLTNWALAGVTLVIALAEGVVRVAPFNTGDLIDDLEVGENLPRRELFDFLLV